MPLNPCFLSVSYLLMFIEPQNIWWMIDADRLVMKAELSSVLIVDRDVSIKCTLVGVHTNRVQFRWPSSVLQRYGDPVSPGYICPQLSFVSRILRTYYKSTINWPVSPRKKFNWSGGEDRSWITFHIFIRHFHAWNSFFMSKEVTKFQFPSNFPTNMLCRCSFSVSWQAAFLFSWRISFPVSNSKRLESSVGTLFGGGRELDPRSPLDFFTTIWSFSRFDRPVYSALVIYYPYPIQSVQFFLYIPYLLTVASTI